MFAYIVQWHHLNKRNHYTVVNLIVAVHSTEDLCAGNMNFWVAKKVFLFIVYVCIRLKFFILSTIFDKY